MYVGFDARRTQAQLAASPRPAKTALAAGPGHFQASRVAGNVHREQAGPGKACRQQDNDATVRR
jgi:hypothetical protein